METLTLINIFEITMLNNDELEIRYNNQDYEIRKAKLLSIYANDTGTINITIKTIT